jgi:hypothetical protein
MVCKLEALTGPSRSFLSKRDSEDLLIKATKIPHLCKSLDKIPKLGAMLLASPTNGSGIELSEHKCQPVTSGT